MEVDCAVCGCKVTRNKWARHVETENIGKQLRGRR